MEPTSLNLAIKDHTKANLSDFVKENSTLIAGVAAFCALTTFFLTQFKDDPELQATLPGLTLLGAFLLAFELSMRAPAPPRHWRLVVFELVLLGLVINVGWYWLKTFPSLWVPLLVAVMNLIFFFAPAILLTLLLTKVLKFVAGQARKQLTSTKLLRIQLLDVFFLSSRGRCGLFLGSSQARFTSDYDPHAVLAAPCSSVDHSRRGGEGYECNLPVSAIW